MTGRNNSNGFTLMETAVAIAVLGLVAAPVLHYMHLAKRQEQIDVTRANLAAIQTALQKFQNNNGYYPCPALLNVAAGTASFGKAQDCVNVPPPPGMPGIAALNGANGNQVVMGAVPGRDLGLSDETMLDGWDDLIAYAVTTNLAVGSVTYYKQNMNSTAGVNNSGVTIKVFDPGTFLQTTVTPAVPFALISFGADGRGAYRASGVAAQACTSGTLDYQNCALTNATFIYSPLGRSAVSTTAGSCTALTPQGCHYDDMVAYPGNGGVCPPGQTIVKVDVAHLLASYNMTGLSYECQTVPVTADTTATADPPDSATPSRSGTSAAALGIDTMDALTCPPGRLFAGIRENGTPYCVAHQIQNGVIAQGTNGTPCNAAYLGQLATDASGNLLICDDDVPASSVAAGAACSSGFNAGAMTFTPAGDIFICNGGTPAPPPPPSNNCNTTRTASLSIPSTTATITNLTYTLIGGGGGGGAGVTVSAYIYGNRGGTGGNGSSNILTVNGTQYTAAGGPGGRSGTRLGADNSQPGQPGETVTGTIASIPVGSTINFTSGEGGGGGGGGSRLKTWGGGGGGGGGGYGRGGNGGKGGLHDNGPAGDNSGVGQNGSDGGTGTAAGGTDGACPPIGNGSPGSATGIPGGGGGRADVETSCTNGTANGGAGGTTYGAGGAAGSSSTFGGSGGGGGAAGRAKFSYASTGPCFL